MVLQRILVPVEQLLLYLLSELWVFIIGLTLLRYCSLPYKFCHIYCDYERALLRSDSHTTQLQESFQYKQFISDTVYHSGKSFTKRKNVTILGKKKLLRYRDPPNLFHLFAPPDFFSCF